MRTTLVNRSRLHPFRLGVFSIFLWALLIAPEAWAQLELGAAGYLDSVNVSTPEVSEDNSILMGGVMARYRTGPWSVSGEYVAGSSMDLGIFGCPCREIERSRAELSAGYSVLDSLDLTAGVRADEIAIIDKDFFFFFFLPVGLSETEADLDLLNFFVGANYESDQQKKIGLVSSARLYRGSADVSSRSGSSRSDDSEGFRGEIGFRMGPPNAAIIVGAAYESFSLSDAGVDISSKPVVFVQYRTNLNVIARPLE